MQNNPRRAQLEAWLAVYARPARDVDSVKVYMVQGRAQPFTFVDIAGYVTRFASTLLVEGS